MIFWSDCRQKLLRFFIYMFVSICCMLGHFQGYMLLNETFRLAITNTFKGSGPKLADWSKWIRITLRSCFCKSLTANWEVSTARSLIIFVNFVQLQTKSFPSLFIENIETKLPFGEPTLRVLIWLFEEIVAKQCLDVSFMCLCRFVALRVTLNNLCPCLLSHAFVDNGPKLEDWSKWICITLRSCFCSLLTSNWEVSTSGFLYSCHILIKLRKFSS